MASSIRTVLDLDITRFQSKAQQAVAVAGKTIGAGMSAEIARKMGPKDAFKSVISALTLSVESVSNKIAEKITGGAQEGWKRAQEFADQASAHIRERYLNRLDTAQKIADVEKEIAAAQKDMDANPRVNGTSAVSRWLMSKSKSPTSFFARTARALDSEDPSEANARAQAATNRAKELEVQLDRLKLQQLDEARAQRTRAANREHARRAARGEIALGSEHAQSLEINRQQDDLRAEYNAKGTTPARRAELAAKAEELVTRQLEMQARFREANRDTAERIHEIESETAALGETSAARLVRLRGEALELEKKAADLTRTQAANRGFLVQAAQKRAQIAKEEFEQKIGAADMDGAATTKSGRRNTTTQGTLARQAMNFRAQAKRARDEGRYDDAVRYGERADSYKSEFEERDYEGMVAARGRLSSRVRVRGPAISKLALSPANQAQKAQAQEAQQQQLDVGKLTSINGHLEKISKNLEPSKIDE